MNEHQWLSAAVRRLLPAAALLLSGAVQADLIGVDPGYPRIDFNNSGMMNFDPSDGSLLIKAEPLELTLVEGGTPLLVGGDRKLRLGVIVDGDCNAVGGPFGDDLRVMGDAFDPDTGEIVKSGVLLTGEVLEMGTGPGGPVSLFDFRLMVTGGVLVDDGDWPDGAEIGIRVTSENSDFLGSCVEPFYGYAKGYLGPLDQEDACALSVDKTCLVLAPPPGEYVCTKPIDALTMIWDGLYDNVRVKAWKDEPGEELLLDQSGIHPGDELTVTGYAPKDGNDVIWEIFDEFGNKLGESQFHLSCSDPQMNGAEDCGLRQGNGKGEDRSLINDWLLEGIVDGGGALDCSPGDDGGEFSDQCEVPAGADGTLCTDRPTEISIRYTGGDCSASDNTQADGKWSCEDFGALTEPVRIKMSKSDGNNVSLDTMDANVLIGEVLTATAAHAGRDEFDSESLLRIYDAFDNLLQEVVLHTSCSQDLRIGDRFGAIEIAGFVNDEQGEVEETDNVVYSYLVSNEGDTDLFGITVNDDQFDPSEVPGSPLDLLAGESATLMTSALITEETTGKVTVVGVTDGGAECMDMDSLTVTIAEPPPCVVKGEDRLKIDDDKIEWKLFNGGTRNATLELIEISWPEALGALDKVKLDGKEISGGDFDPPNAVIDMFKGKVKDRRIEPGEDARLKFEFDDKYKGARATDFAIRLYFEEGCMVEFVPGMDGGDYECTKPIDELRMIWDGTETVDLRAWKDEPGETLLAEIFGIMIGDEVAVSGYAPKDGNDVIWEVFSAGGDKLGESEFHLSCSDADMNGPEDCGKRQGNGKGNDADLLNDWLFEGLVDAGGELDCTP